LRTIARLLAVTALGALTSVGVAQDDSKPEPEPAGVAVLVLGKTQLLEGAGGYPAFCKKNDGKKRSALRSEIVARLKAIAAEEQPKLIEALGSPDVLGRLWVVNAVVVRMSKQEVEQARKLDLVKWIYPAGAVPPGPDGKGVAEVLAAAERGPFVTKGKEIPWNLDLLKVPKVWKELEITGEGALVVSFDAGLNYRHEDLRGGVWRNPGEVPNNGKDDDGNGRIDDLYGFDFTRNTAEVLATDKRQHGTLTSSVVIGDGTGGKVTGVAPRAKLMAVRAGGGPYLAGQAFQYALEQGGDVVSMSFSIPKLGNTRGLWRMLAEQATCAGLALVSGAGNFGRKAKVPVQVRIPEGIPCVICAGGVTKKLKIPAFTSKGPVEWAAVKFFEDHPLPKGLVKPDVSAFPGPGIALVALEDEGYLPDDNRRRGNSLSAPQVTGVIALMFSANPELTPWKVKAILEDTARDLKPRGKDTDSGAGLVDAYKAVKAALRLKK